MRGVLARNVLAAESIDGITIKVGVAIEARLLLNGVNNDALQIRRRLPFRCREWKFDALGSQYSFERRLRTSDRLSQTLRKSSG